MISFELSKSRRARVWLGEALPFEVVAENTIHEKIRVAKPSRPIASAIAVELFIPEGGKFSYACLGGRLSENIAMPNALDVVLSLEGAGLKYNEALAGRLDNVRIGLPEEYASAVVEGFEKGAREIAGCPAGRLSVSCAAHGLIGSNRHIFRRVAGLVLMILALQSNDPSAIKELME